MPPGSLNAGLGSLPASPSVASAGVTAFLSAIRRMPHRAWVWIMRVESRRALLMLSDHILSDIGLTRAQAEREYLKPFWRE